MLNVCIDPQGYKTKPNKNEISKISNRIASYKVNNTIPFIADKIGNKGHTFTPALFHNNRRKKENFLSMQVFALDFDKKEITYQSIKKLANDYQLPIAFSYKTFSYEDNNERFRIVFVLDAEITDCNIAEMILYIFIKLFPGSDTACRDVSRIFFGGKGLLDLNNQLCPLSILFTVFHKTMYIHDTHRHFKRDMENFGRKYGVFVDEKTSHIPILQIKDDFNKNGANLPESFYIYKGAGTNAPNYYALPKYTIIENQTANTLSDMSNTTSNLSGNSHDEAQPYFSRLHSDYLSKAIEICPLLRDAGQNIKQLDHNSCFGLLTNLIHIDSGEKFFRLLINMDEYKDMSKWNYDIRFAQKSNYKPMNCSEFCKYCNTCHHNTTLLQTIKKSGKFVVLNQKSSYHSLEDAMEDLRLKFINAINATDNSLYILEAQTAIGKTQIYCNYISQNYNTQKFFIAVPTIILKNEVSQRLKELGVPVLTAPSVNELKFIESNQHSLLLHLLEQGCEKDVRKKVLQLLKDMSKIDNNLMVKGNYKKAKQELEHYLNFYKEITKPTTRVIVSTHAQLLHMNANILKEYQVIVDEDILKTICLAQKHIILSDIQRLLECQRTSDFQKKQLKSLLDLPTEKPILFQETMEPFGSQIILSQNIQSNFNGLKEGCILYRINDRILYYYPYQLIDKKIIIMSASTNKDIYKDYFSCRNVKYFKCKEASIKGQILQYHKYSCSRHMVQTIGFKKIKSGVNSQIKKNRKKKTPKIPLITFKAYSQNELYFGNTEGLNEYENRDIAVLGTPHLNAASYYMLAFAIDHNVTIEKAMLRSLTYNGVRFLFMTYSNVLLQNIQMYLVSSELEQAVGRARVLRNSCTVYVFSNFPVKQALYIDDDYLEKE